MSSVRLYVKVMDAPKSNLGAVPPFIAIEVQTQEGCLLTKVEVYPLEKNLQELFATEIQRVISKVQQYLRLFLREHGENAQIFIQGGCELDDIQRQLTAKCWPFAKF